VSVYDENGVPVIYRGPDQRIGLSEPLEHDDELLLGESVVIHCKSLRGTGETGTVTFSIGAENLDEAVKSCIGAFDVHHLDPPGVSSDSEHTPTGSRPLTRGSLARSPTTTPARPAGSRRSSNEYAPDQAAHRS
jgi:hypothetical protein